MEVDCNCEPDCQVCFPKKYTFMAVCENCGWPIGEGTEHRKDEYDGLCVIYQNGQRVGFKRRKTPSRRMYR